MDSLATIITEKMIFGGDCTAKINGKIVFIPGLLPLERAEVRLTEEKKDFCRGEAVRILEPSPHRVEAPCPLYGECGGCNMQHADTAYQRELRKAMLCESFSRARIPPAAVPEPEILYDRDWEYRSRFQLCGGGLKAKKSDRIIPLKDCPVAVPEIRAFLAGGSLADGLVRLFGANGKIAVSGGAGKNTPGGKNKEAEPVFEAEANGKSLQFDVSCFFQSNLFMLERLVPVLCEGLGGGTALDLYGGVGTFAAFLTDLFEKTILVEQNRAAVAFAEKNLAGTNHVCCAASGEKWVRTPAARERFETVVADPPRTGMEKAVLAWLLENKPPLIRYLSCDPPTLARDSRILLDGGYHLKRLIMADFYPQTSHIEALAFFEL